LHGIVQHQFIAWNFAIPQQFCSSAKQTSANCLRFARFGTIYENRTIISQRLEAKNLHTVECLRHAKTKDYHLHSMCSILGQNSAERMVLAIRCNYHLQAGNLQHQHFVTDICKLDVFCVFLKLKDASGMVFATCWNYHLHIALNGMVFAACCG